MARMLPIPRAGHGSPGFYWQRSCSSWLRGIAHPPRLELSRRLTPCDYAQGSGSLCGSSVLARESSCWRVAR
jgi:hypothetical protein